MIYKNPIFSLWLFLFILALTSCGSKKRVALPADFIMRERNGSGLLTGWAEALKGEWIAPVS